MTLNTYNCASLFRAKALALNWSLHQCDQTGLFLKVLGKNLATKVAQVNCDFLGYFENIRFKYPKTVVGTCWATFEKFGPLFIRTSLVALLCTQIWPQFYLGSHCVRFFYCFSIFGPSYFLVFTHFSSQQQQPNAKSNFSLALSLTLFGCSFSYFIFS